VLVSVSETHSEEQVLHWGEVRETCRHPTSTVRAPEGGLLLDDSIWETYTTASTLAAVAAGRSGAAFAVTAGSHFGCRIGLEEGKLS
jgi:hypothetical protein